MMIMIKLWTYGSREKFGPRISRTTENWASRRYEELEEARWKCVKTGLHRLPGVKYEDSAIVRWT